MATISNLILATLKIPTLIKGKADGVVIPNSQVCITRIPTYTDQGIDKFARLRKISIFREVVHAFVVY
jgi:hypothetical protein